MDKETAKQKVRKLVEEFKEYSKEEINKNKQIKLKNLLKELFNFIKKGNQINKLKM